MPQMTTKVVPARAIIDHPFFEMGFDAARRGIEAWDVDFEQWTKNEQLRYERGRQFACLTPGLEQLKPRRAKRVTEEVLRAYCALRATRVIL